MSPVGEEVRENEREYLWSSYVVGGSYIIACFVNLNLRGPCAKNRIKELFPILVRGNVCLAYTDYEIKNMGGLERFNYGLLT